MRVRTVKALLIAVATLAAGVCSAAELVVRPSNSTGMYRVGEKIGWRVELRGPTTQPTTQATYTLKRGGFTDAGGGTIDLSSGSATIETTLDAPGWMLAEVKANVDGKRARALGGAIAGAEQIEPSAPRPEDFDAFWAGKIEALNAVPADPQVEPGDSGKPGVAYEKVTLNNVNGTHVYAELAKPQREGKFPALLLLQYAGVYALPKANVANPASEGWLAMDVMAHDLPLDKDPEFYKQQGATSLKNYFQIGHEDREKSYFLRMYLGCYRAADYLAHRPDWDGRTLVVTGGSQGGQQSIVTAGLYPKVSAMMVIVPAGCDTTGPWVGRAPGFPYWYGSSHGKPEEKAVMETSRYFDPVNFASRITCPALVCFGLIDDTSPPSGVLAAYNQMRGPKEMLVMPTGDHHGGDNWKSAYGVRSHEWLAALVKGEAAPVK